MISKHVTSLELSKRLKELGVPQNTHFYWGLKDDKSNGGLPTYYQIIDKIRLEKSFCYTTELYSAYLATELGLWLPSDHTIDHSKLLMGEWNSYSYEDQSHFIEKKEVDARAKMLIHLIENGIIKPEDLK